MMSGAVQFWEGHDIGAPAGWKAPSRRSSDEFPQGQEKCLDISACPEGMAILEEWACHPAFLRRPETILYRPAG